MIPRLPLVRDRRLDQSDPLVGSGDIELLAWLPPAAPVPGGGGGHPGRAVRRPLRAPQRRSPQPGLDLRAEIVMASQPNSSAKKKEEKGKNIQVVVRCR